MSYSRRFRFTDGKSSLHRVEFAREFETRLAGAPHAEADRADGTPRREIHLSESTDDHDHSPDGTADRTAGREAGRRDPDAVRPHEHSAHREGNRDAVDSEGAARLPKRVPML